MCALRENGTWRLANAQQQYSRDHPADPNDVAGFTDNHNGFIRFTYTPRDLSACRVSPFPTGIPYRGNKEHLLSFVIAISITRAYTRKRNCRNISLREWLFPEICGFLAEV